MWYSNSEYFTYAIALPVDLIVLRIAVWTAILVMVPVLGVEALVVATLRYWMRVQTCALEDLFKIIITIIKLTKPSFGVCIVPSPLLQVRCSPDWD
jgi:hypothetical protein